VGRGGALVESMNSADISHLLSQLGLFHHLFADDPHQAYIIHTDPWKLSITQMSPAIDTLTSWMVANGLLLDPSKTQVIWISGRMQLARLTIKDSPLSFLT